MTPQEPLPPAEHLQEEADLIELQQRNDTLKFLGFVTLLIAAGCAFLFWFVPWAEKLGEQFWEGMGR